MFQIGELARIAEVSPRTLRHYDDLGLLSPSRLESGYRSYGAADLKRLRRILALRDVGLPLERIGALLDLSPGEHLVWLKRHGLTLHDQLRETQQRLERLNLLLQEVSMQPYQPEVRLMPAQQVVAASGSASSYRAVTAPMSRLFNQAEAYLKAAGGQASGPCLVIWHADYGTDERFTLECLIPYVGEIEAGEEVQIYRLPATPEMAVVLHRGSYERLGDAYAALTTFVEQEGYLRAGHLREVYLHFGHTEEEHLTEIHLPVQRRMD
ncbi:MerR family transcriptional regulator [Deinococcus sp.]|uniref:MerR family transcriptional regulator n=1 Tax=Deinococcus sp. TaxID=47478 RepID=UPI003CC5CADA